MSRQNKQTIARVWYEELKKSGDLQEMFPTLSLSGVWEEDSSKFMEEYHDFDMDMNRISIDDIFEDEEEY